MAGATGDGSGGSGGSGESGATGGNRFGQSGDLAGGGVGGVGGVGAGGGVRDADGGVGQAGGERAGRAGSDRAGRAGRAGDDGDGGAVEELELSSLEVSGPHRMYPAFDPDIRHYALTCRNDPTLRVTATAARGDASLTLLRADPDDNHHAVGTLDVWVTLSGFHDIAIELEDDGEATMYIVHCRPDDFTGTRILKRRDGASEGLLFVSPAGFFGPVKQRRAKLA